MVQDFATIHSRNPQLEVSINGNTPKSSIFIGYSLLNHQAIGASQLMETQKPLLTIIYHIYIYSPYIHHILTTYSPYIHHIFTMYSPYINHIFTKWRRCLFSPGCSGMPGEHGSQPPSWPRDLGQASQEARNIYGLF